MRACPAKFQVVTATKAGSMLFEWPSIAALRASIEDDSDLCFYEAKISMVCFGAFSKKPLVFQGTWLGIAVLEFFQSLVSKKMETRVGMKLMEKKGKWQTLAAFTCLLYTCGHMRNVCSCTVGIVTV